MIICSLRFEPFHWFLIPTVNNTPAFITASKWLAQSLLITNIIGFSLYKLRSGSSFSETDRSVVSFLIVFSLIHIIVVCFLIFWSLVLKIYRGLDVATLIIGGIQTV